MSRNSRKLKVVAPVVPAKPPTPEAFIIIRRCKRNVEYGIEAQVELIEKMNKNPLNVIGNSLYELGWAEGKVTAMQKAQFFQQVLEGTEFFLGKEYGRLNVELIDEAMDLELLTNSLKQTLTYLVQSITRSLLRNEWRGASSSGFSNGIEACKREAAACVLEDMQHMLNDLNEKAD